MINILGDSYRLRANVTVDLVQVADASTRTLPEWKFWMPLEQKSRPTNQTELMPIARHHLHRGQKQPQIIANLFLEQYARDAA